MFALREEDNKVAKSKDKRGRNRSCLEIVTASLKSPAACEYALITWGVMTLEVGSEILSIST